MRDDCPVMGSSVGDQPIVGDLQKGRYRRGLVILPIRPCAYLCKARHNGLVCCKKECLTPSLRPIRQIILARIKLIGNLLNACHFTSFVLFFEPCPKCRAEIEPVVKILGLNEYISIKEISHQSITPTSRPRLLNVSVLATPSIRKASR